MDRWATFDCYGTLVDWNAGIRGALARLLPDADSTRCWCAITSSSRRWRPSNTGRTPTCSPRWRTGRQRVRRRPAVGARAGAPRAPAGVARIPRRPGRARGRAKARLAALHPLEHGPRASRRVAGSIGVPSTHSIWPRRSDEPAHGHWERSSRDSGAEHRGTCMSPQSLFHDIAVANAAGPCGRVDQPPRRAGARRCRPTRELPGLTGLGATLDELVAP